MRIRTIKPEFFLHESLFQAEVEFKLPLRLAFSGLWCAADREGRFKWRPMRLGAQILPYDDIDFSEVMDALEASGFVVRYSHQGEEFGFIPSFKAHQCVNLREAQSSLPDPNSAEAVKHTCTHVQARVEGKGREWNMEGKGTETPIVPLATEKKAWEPNETHLRFNALFGRRATTAWTDKEKRALANLGAIQEDDMKLIESRYARVLPPSEDYRRRELLTLLNNFQGELDKERNYKPCTNGKRILDTQPQIEIPEFK